MITHSSLEKQITALRTLVDATRCGRRFKPAEISLLNDTWEDAISTLQWLAANKDAVKDAKPRGASG